MKSRTKELLDRSIAAMVAAIEIYNKPDFIYREETFSVLALNAWELLIKAKWLAKNNNKIRSLYVTEKRKNKDGSLSKKITIKRTRSGNPFTHSIDFLAKKLVENQEIDIRVWKNIQALMEMRDSSIHFYNHGNLFSKRLQEVGSASLKNYVRLVNDWFNRDLSDFNFYLMPLAFISISKETTAIILNPQERNFIKYIDSLEEDEKSDDGIFSITVNVDVKFTRSKAKDALNVKITNDPNATEVRLTEEQIREKYPWDYDKLCTVCAERYSDFKMNQRYHDLRKSLFDDDRFCKVRHLDPGNPNSQKKVFYNPNILNELDKHYRKSPTKSST